MTDASFLPRTLLSIDTIFALATAPGRAGVAVVRISGPSASQAIRALTRSRTLPAPRVATLRTLRSADGEKLDQALLLWFPGPGSFTGEDVAELHLHGGRAVVEGVLAALAALPDLRPAEPGEFTRRAFDAGRLDLTAVEGLADLIAADTAAQRRQALRQLAGDLAAVYEGWAERLTRALAWLEAEIDFADEDLPDGMAGEVQRRVLAVRDDIAAHLADNRRGEILRDGFSIAIVGPPNAGKSSLLNTLAQRDAAIVSETAGTTRDVIEVRLDLGGYAVVLADTAGLRAGSDAIEAEGIRRARARAEAADLVLVLLDAAERGSPDAAVAEVIEEAAASGRLLLVRNKIDLLSDRCGLDGAAERELDLSVQTGEGVPELLSTLGAIVAARVEGAENAPALTRLRHRQALEACHNHLERFALASQTDLAAEDVRLAVRELGRITGRVDVEDLLDVIFRDFCIGK